MARGKVETMRLVRIFRPGARVTLDGLRNTTAQVLRVVIEADRVSYEVAWWYCGERRTAWVEDFEIGHACDAARASAAVRLDE